jgi:hypothetical protein
VVDVVGSAVGVGGAVGVEVVVDLVGGALIVELATLNTQTPGLPTFD